MKIYIAGPDVFRPDALTWAEEARALLSRSGHEALTPLDNEETTAEGIFRANLELISRADAVVANLNPFRGAEPDSGTCFEVGCGIALGKRVIGYLKDTRTQVDKLPYTAILRVTPLQRYNGISAMCFIDGIPVNRAIPGF